jgi:hypothetical protein
VPHGDPQLARDLAKGQAETAKAKHGAKSIETAVALRICVELVDKRELAIPPCSVIRKDAFDQGPRPLELLVRELLGRRPAAPRSRVGRQVLGGNVVGAMRPSNCRQPSRSDVDAKRLDMAAETAGSSVQFHQPWRHHGNNRRSFKVSWTFLNVDCYRCESRASLASLKRTAQTVRGPTRTPLPPAHAASRDRSAQDRSDVRAAVLARG